MEGFLPILVMALIGLLGFLLAGRIELTSSVRLFIIFIVVNIALPSMIFSSIVSRDITSDLLQDLAVIYTTSLTLNLTGIFSAIFSAGWPATESWKESSSPFYADAGIQDS
jgi:malate permease and related proteins